MRRLNWILIFILATVLLWVGGIGQPLEVAHAQTDRALVTSVPVNTVGTPFSRFVNAGQPGEFNDPTTDRPQISDGSPASLSDPLLIDVTIVESVAGVFTTNIALTPALPITGYDLTNTGPLDIEMVCNSGSAGTFTATVTVTSNSTVAPTTLEFFYSCTFTGAPVYSATSNFRAGGAGPLANGDTIEMGGVHTGGTLLLGTPNQSALTITNTGSLPLSISAVTIAGPEAGEFNYNGGQAFDVAPSANHEVSISCTPTAVGPRTATINITHNAAGSPVNYTLRCLGTPYTSTPAPEATIAISTQPNVNGTALFTLSSQGAPVGSDGYTVDDIFISPGSLTASATSGSVDVNNPLNVTIGCTSATEQVINGELAVTYSYNFAASVPPLAASNIVVRYPVVCTVSATPPAQFSSTPAPGSAITINATTTTPASQTIAISNTAAVGAANFDVTGIVSSDPRITVAPATLTGVAPGAAAQNLTITCTHNAAATITATVTLTTTAPNQPTAAYNVTCNVTATATNPIFSSNPGPNSTITINATVNQTVNSTITFTNLAGAGAQTLNITNITSNSARITLSQNTFNLTPSQNAILTISCLSNVAETINTTIVLNTNDPNFGTVTYNVTCVVTAPSLYQSSPAPGGTIQINAALSTVAEQQLVISRNTAQSGTLNLLQFVITNPNPTVIAIGVAQGTPVPSPGNPVPLTGSQTYSVIVRCQSATAGVFTASIIVRHDNGQAGTTNEANYSVNCNVGNVIVTPGTGTALAPVDPTTLTQCPPGLALSTPYPQSAAGEFLLVNCFIVSAAGTVNVPLSQVLTSPRPGVTAEEIAVLTANPAFVSFWRMGSWFLTESQYNPATQTFTFEAPAGVTTYGVFFGAITRRVGAQGSFFAGTTTGDARDGLREISVSPSDPTPFAALVSLLFVVLVGAVFFTRRFGSAETNA